VRKRTIPTERPPPVGEVNIVNIVKLIIPSLFYIVLNAHNKAIQMLKLSLFLMKRHTNKTSGHALP
jgi:hypothetical protein